MNKKKKKLQFNNVRSILKSALAEDIKRGDVTSKAIIPKDLKIKADIILKQSGVIAGLDVAKWIFKLQDKNIAFKALVKDGSFIKKKGKKSIATLKGNAQSILAAERTALNILSHLSGVATLTYKFVKKTRKYKVKVTDTRKTTPNLRILDKYAVRAGGGYNHRMGLYERILIKDNHIKSIGKTPAECVLKAKRKNRKLIEVEIKRISEFRRTLEAKPDIIMLDNMNLNDIKKAMKIRKDYLKNKKLKKLTEIEVSGKVNLNNIEKIASCGVDYISIGALTHSNPSLDIALKVK